MAALAVQVGVNLQRGQELIVTAPLEARDLVERVAVHAYRAGAPLVTCLFDDPALIRVRFDHADADTLDTGAGWMSSGVERALQAGAARLYVYGPYPDLLDGVSPDKIARVHAAAAAATRTEALYTADLRTNWCAIPYVTSEWARRVYPALAADAARARLWDDVFDVVRVSNTDPVAAWRTHVQTLGTRRAALQARSFHALHLRGAETDLVVGLAPGHVWIGGAAKTEKDIETVCNMPTEEVFTAPHRERVNGHMRLTRPLALGGAIVEGLMLAFRDGVAVDVRAERGGEMFAHLLHSDDGARRLGEIGLAPHSSLVARKNVLFYNTLLDENAASHVAFGQSYGACLPASASAESHGANQSAIHIDCMLGAGDTDVDGLSADGARTPIMRQGEFVL